MPLGGAQLTLALVRALDCARAPRISVGLFISEDETVKLKAARANALRCGMVAGQPSARSADIRASWHAPSVSAA